MKIRLVIFGTSPFGLPSFQALANDKRFVISAVVTQPARPVGRKQSLTASPVAAWSTALGYPVLTPASLKNSSAIEQLKQYPSDVYIVAAYGLILPPAILARPARGALNIHGSLLPLYRGASPISAAILHGDHGTGVTMMLMDAGCDTGPILTQQPTAIEPTDTRLSLEQRLSTLAATEIIPTLTDWLSGAIKPRTQPKDGVSLAPRLNREAGRANWDQVAFLERQIRAYQPWPGVWTIWKNKEIKLLAASIDHQSVSAPPGTIVRLKTAWGIACRDGILVPTLIQFAGRQAQPARTVPGSYPDFIGAVLG